MSKLRLTILYLVPTGWYGYIIREQIILSTVWYKIKNKEPFASKIISLEKTI